jgi:predicted dehydrogenase
MNRREFLLAGAAAGLALSGVHTFAQEKKLRAGLIGCGWYGKSDLFRLIQVAPVEVVSLCDVDKKMLAEAAGMVAQRQQSKKEPRLFGDYRKMLAEKDLDVVLVGTPDHWHALPMIAAVEAGADVYVQKPISVDVSEGRAMLAAARKNKRVVQVGTQRRSTPHLVEAREKVVKAGELGKVGLVEVYCYYPMRNNENPPVTAVPDFFDYEMWTGPAPLREYDAPEYEDLGARLPHKRWWRAFMEYGNGIVGDMCIHMLDMVRWQLDLGWPKRISSTGGIFVQKKAKSNITDTQTATFGYDDFDVVWQHRTWGAAADPEYPWGATIYGDKGTLKLSVYKYEFFPLNKKEPTLSGKAVFDPEDKYPEDKTERGIEPHVATANRAHMVDFLKAIATRDKPVADIEQGHISTAACILANLSQKVGRTLVYDPERHAVKGDDEATKLLTRPYRKGWTHPGA